MRSYLQILVSISIMSFIADCKVVDPDMIVVYKSKGETVHLPLTNHQNISGLKWRKRDKLIATLVDQKSDVQFRKKNDIIASNGTLVIKNLTDDDEAIYKAEIGTWETVICKYHLKLYEAVSEPQIEYLLDQQSNFFNVCQIKCSADGDSVIYDCNSQHCTPTNITVKKVNITVNTAGNGTLQCVVSNNFSTKKTLMPLDNKCLERTQEANETTKIILIVVIFSIIVLIISILMMFIIKKSFPFFKKKNQNEGTHQEDKGINTVYSVVIKPSSTGTPAETGATQKSPPTDYDVPSTRAMSSNNGSGHCKISGQQNDENTTVYWKLGQK